MTPLFRRVRLFIQAMVRAARQKFAGKQVLASARLHDARISTCKVCPRYNPTFQTCELCGCNVPLKSLLLTEKCPEARWDFPDITF